MNFPKNTLRLLAAAGILASALMAQHPRQVAETIDVIPGGTANPMTMDLSSTMGDHTKYIVFAKTNGAEFTITFSGPSPCTGPATIRSSGGAAVCRLKPQVCKSSDAGTDHKCHFNYNTGSGDPDIAIDEGYNPPPPPKPEPGKKGEKKTTPKK